MNVSDPVLAKAVQLHKSGDFAGAIRLYEKFVRSSPKDAAAHNLLGLACFQAGKLERAADLIGKALVLKPGLPDAHFNLGTVFQALEQHELAIEHYRQAIGERPTDADAHNNLGIALKALGRTAEVGSSIFARRLLCAADGAWLHFNLGNALQENRQNQEAIGQYEQAIRLMPNPTEAHINLGNALLALNRNADAAIQYRVVLAPDA